MNHPPPSVAPLISTEELAARLDEPSMKVIDATFFLPGQGDAHAEFHKAHIPGAVFFDVDMIADPANPAPHMLPSTGDFAEAVGKLGVANDDYVVTYGVAGPRVWWMFRAMGHDRVSVLDGGLKAWMAEDRPIESGEIAPIPETFHARLRPELVRDFDQVQAELAGGGVVVDARSAERFHGEAPEPRPGLSSGHMPGATNLPASALVEADGRFKSLAHTEALLNGAGAGPGSAATATCGSGVTACAIALARARLGRWDTAVYDGSWSEWAAQPGAPIAKGPSEKGQD